MRINGFSRGNGRYWVGCGGLIAVGIASLGEVACSALATNCGESRTCRPSDGGQSGQNGQGGADDAGGIISDGNGGRKAGSGGEHSTGGGASGRSETDGGAGDAADAKSPSVPVEAGSSGDAGSRTRGCPEGFADCNADPEDGCEVELAKDVDHCGACDTSCASAGVRARSCALGACEPTCDGTHTDCNGIGTDGCEAALDDDAKNCGACGHSCSVNGATSACKERQCKVTCLPGHADCNGNPDDGCEVDLKTDAASCGACGHVCAVTNASATACSAGACKPACAANYGDCNSPASAAADDGCETALTLATSCGACGHNCQGGTCTRGTCDSVTLASGLPVPGELAVDDRYVHFMTAPEHIVRYSLERVTTSGTNHERIGEYPFASLVADGTYVFLSVPDLAEDHAKGKVVRVTSGMEDFKEVFLGDVGPIAADGKFFYFSRATSPGGFTDGHIYQMSRDLGASGQVSSATGPFVGVASDGSTVFGLTASGLMAQPLPSGSPKQTALFPAPNPRAQGARLAFDGSHLYTSVAEANNGVAKLVQMPKTLQGTPTVLATSTSGSPVAADANFVYYADGNGLYRVRNTGGTPVKIAASTGIAGIVVWKGAVYWTSLGLSSDAGSVNKLAVFAD